jgi:DNA modification methylase
MNKIEFGDCRDTMRRWASEGVKAQMCVTSPPYFGLRDYKVEGQIGLEQTPEEYITAMVEVFRCVRDVLADDGTLWLNIGDSYAGYHGNKNAPYDAAPSNKGGYFENQRKTLVNHNGIKNKDLIGIPWMLAFALRADGWFLRQDIIWHKPNPMPESVRDRCTKAHEYVFLLSKSEKYFFDSEAMKETATYPQGPGNKTHRHQNGAIYGLPEKASCQSGLLGIGPRETRNRRSVWTVATRPYKGAHFATFPPALIEPCILAGTSERGHCPKCGARWARETEPVVRVKHTGETDSQYPKGSTANRLAMLRQAAREQGMEYTGARQTTGWKSTCTCGCDPVPDIVLDCFMGSGTTAAVSLQHGRQYLGCELNPEYGPLQQERINKERTLFNGGGDALP